MPIGLHFLKNVLDLAVWTDDERCPGDARYLLAVHVLFYQNAVGNGDFLVGVGQQGKGQALLVGKFSLCRRGIRRYAKQHGAGLLNLFI